MSDQVPLARQLPDPRLIERPALGRRDQGPGGHAGNGILHALVGRDDRVGLHDHPRAPAVGIVVGGPVPVVGECPDRDQHQLEDALLARDTDHSLIERPGEKAGTQREDRDAHLPVREPGQPRRRLDHDARLGVDRNDDALQHRHQDLAIVPVDDQDVVAAGMEDIGDAPDRFAVRRLHREPDELEAVMLPSGSGATWPRSIVSS